MWNFASNCIAGSVGLKSNSLKHNVDASESSDDEVNANPAKEEGLECPICWDSFNIVENVPYVLWCGHTLCKNCILGLQWAVVKFPALPIQLPLFISCPWCNLLSFRVVYRGDLKFPRKNYFLLWMVESMNGDRVNSHSTCCGDAPQVAWSSNSSVSLGSHGRRTNLSRGQVFHHNESPGSNINNSPMNHGRRTNLSRGQVFHHSESPGSNINNSPTNHRLIMERLHSSVQKSLVFFGHLAAKFPLIFIFLLIIIYVIPASATILALYMLITVLFALPSLLILYFAYPSLNWLVREIIT